MLAGCQRILIDEMLIGNKKYDFINMKHSSLVQLYQCKISEDILLLIFIIIKNVSRVIQIYRKAISSDKAYSNERRILRLYFIIVLEISTFTLSQPMLICIVYCMHAI
jgi:hypothetical protein